MSADDEAVVRLVWPETVSVDAVVEARDVAPVVVNPVVDALPSVDCPVTESVPLDTSEEVAVIVPPVSVFTVPEIAERVFVKKLVDVAFTVVKLVMTEVSAVRSVEK